ncbi:MAG: Mini-ribonuclease 3 [Filifactoraceae bacterium]
MEIIPNKVNPLLLAFIGDSVLELLFRVHIVDKNQNSKILDVHKKAVRFAKASSQAKIVLSMKEEGFLTEEELDWVRKGRNQNSHPPKNASITEYKYATGFETMVGFLHVTGQDKRIDEIVEKAINIIS